jgi:AraC-like DNA-binding protein
MIPAGKAFTLHSGGGTVNLLFFATDRFESLAGNHLDIRIGPVRFTVNPRPEQVAALTHLLDRCGPVLMNPNTVEEIRADLNQQLILATAVAFRATPERSIDGTEPFGVFARAQGFIEQNLHLALTVGQIASGVGVTERQLQIAFHRQGDTTPLAYVRQVRLYRVRRDLRDATPGIRVASVAARWGFTHYARFEAAFTREFNRLPVVGGQGQAVSTLLEN